MKLRHSLLAETADVEEQCHSLEDEGYGKAHGEGDGEGNGL